MSNIKSWERFNESVGGETEVVIDGFKYLIKKANIDVSQFDYEGRCDRYAGSYVVIEEGDISAFSEDRIRVREFDGTVR